MDYTKLKKKQLTSLITSKDSMIKDLEKTINSLENDLETEKENNLVNEMKTLELTIDISKIDQDIIEFYEERIQNSIYKDLVVKYEKDLQRILKKYT